MKRSLAKSAALPDRTIPRHKTKFTAGFPCFSSERGLRVCMNTTVLCVRANCAPHTSRLFWLYIYTGTSLKCSVLFGGAVFERGTFDVTGSRSAVGAEGTQQWREAPLLGCPVDGGVRRLLGLPRAVHAIRNYVLWRRLSRVW